MASILDQLTGRRKKKLPPPPTLEPWRAHNKTHFETRRPLGPTCGFARTWRRDPEQVAGVIDLFRSLLDDRAANAAIERDEVPIPAVADREGYYPGEHLTYWLSGLADYRVLAKLVPAATLRHVLDFGGATGRVARHAILAHPDAQVTIADLNVNHIDWVDRYFGPSVRGVKVSPFPHLPLADRSVSLCIGFSVFTHIDSYESGWLAEIARVLTDDGYAVLTFHSEHCWLIAQEHELMLFNGLRQSPGFLDVYRPGQPMPFERMAFDYTPNSIEHNCNVFTHSDYVRRVWGKWFEIVDIIPRGHYDFQAVAVLRKRRR